MWDVVAVCNITNACERHLLSECLTKAGQALRYLATQQRCSTTWINIVLNHPLQGPFCVWGGQGRVYGSAVVVWQWWWRQHETGSTSECVLDNKVRRGVTQVKGVALRPEGQTRC